MEVGWGKRGVCPHVPLSTAFEHLAAVSGPLPPFAPSSPSSQVLFVVILNFDEKVMIFLQQCWKNRTVTRGAFEYFDSSSPTLTVTKMAFL